MTLIEQLSAKVADTNTESYFSTTRRLDYNTAMEQRAKLARDGQYRLIAWLKNLSDDDKTIIREHVETQKNLLEARGGMYLPAKKVLPYL